MTETVKKLKVNRTLEGRTCGWCQAALTFGEDVAVCQACQDAHHAACWDGKGGCAHEGCVNRPLERLETPVNEEVPAGNMRCPHCQAVIAATRVICPHCQGVTTPEGVYDGPKANAPGAVASMWYGIAGLLICGLIFGWVAIGKAKEARKAIASDPTLGGSGYATAGLVLGILDLVLWALVIVARVAST